MDEGNNRICTVGETLTVCSNFSMFSGESNSLLRDGLEQEQEPRLTCQDSGVKSELSSSVSITKMSSECYLEVSLLSSAVKVDSERLHHSSQVPLRYSLLGNQLSVPAIPVL